MIVDWCGPDGQKDLSGAAPGCEQGCANSDKYHYYLNGVRDVQGATDVLDTISCIRHRLRHGSLKTAAERGGQS